MVNHILFVIVYYIIKIRLMPLMRSRSIERDRESFLKWLLILMNSSSSKYFCATNEMLTRQYNAANFDMPDDDSHVSCGQKKKKTWSGDKLKPQHPTVTPVVERGGAGGLHRH